MSTLLVGTTEGLWAGARRLVGGPVGAVAARPGGGWWAVIGGRSLVTGDLSGNGDGGRPPVDLPGPAATCVAALDGEVALVGTAEARLLRVEGSSTEWVGGFDRAEGRSRWYTPWGGPPDIRSVAIGPPGDLWVNVHVGGILRSTDGGKSWRPTIDVDADVHQVAVAADRVVAATAYGMAQSLDGGATWSFVTDGLRARYCRAVAVAGDWLLLSASTGPSTSRGALYRRPLAAAPGEPFLAVGEGLPEWFDGNVDTGWLAASPEGGAVALAAPGGSLYVSEDQGRTWVRADPPPEGRITGLAYA